MTNTSQVHIPAAFDCHSLPLTTICHLIQLCGWFSPFIAVDVLLALRVCQVCQRKRLMLQQQCCCAGLAELFTPSRSPLLLVPCAHLFQSPVHESNQYLRLLGDCFQARKRFWPKAVAQPNPQRHELQYNCNVKAQSKPMETSQPEHQPWAK